MLIRHFLPILSLVLLGAACDYGKTPRGVTETLVKEAAAGELISLDHSWAFEGNQLITGPTGKGDLSKSYNDPVEKHMAADKPCATFSLELPSTYQQETGLFIRNYFTAYRLYHNGEIIAGKGQVSCDKEVVVAEWGSTVIPVPVDRGPHKLILQMSVSSFRISKFRTKVILSNFTELQRIQTARKATEGLIFGAVIIIGFFNFIFFTTRRNDLAPFYFSLVCLFAVAYMSVNGQLFITLVFPGISHLFMAQLIPVTIYLTAWALLAFIEHTFVAHPVWFKRLVWSATILATIANFTLEPELAVKVFLVHRAILMIALVFVLGHLYYKKRKNRHVVNAIAAGLLIGVDFVAAQVTYFQPVIYAYRYSGIFCFALINAAFFADRLGRALRAVQQQEKELREANTELEKANGQKQVLLRELYHRVKNNMQMILSMLWLPDEGNEANEKMRLFLIDLENRIKTMASVHEELFRADDISNVKLAPYIQRLVENIAHSMGKERQVETHLHIDEGTSLDVDRAISCGLVVNELVTNSFKYAFAGVNNPEITIKLTEENQQVHLVIKDNGRGYPAGLDPAKSGSMGLGLVEDLAELTFRSKAEFTNENGARFDMKFSSIPPQD